MSVFQFELTSSSGSSWLRVNYVVYIALYDLN